MNFEIGSTYERKSDHMTAIVAKTDEKKALLWLPTGQEEWIKPADVPSLWRRYETCPACLGTRTFNAVHDDRGDFAKRPPPADCPTCKGTGRIYP